MKKTKAISFNTALLIVVIVIVAIMLIVFSFLKKPQSETKKPSSSSSNVSSKEDEVIQNIRNAFDAVREEFVVNQATIDGYQPSSFESNSDGVGEGTSLELKDFIISKLGDNVIDETEKTLVELNLDMFQKSEGEQIELINGYHVYLSSGEDENEKFITIVYKDDVFCHGMAYYNTENNLIIDKSNNLYPVLVAQIRLSQDDLSYYLEPVKSVK